MMVKRHRARQALGWLAAPMTFRPRRSTVAIWALVFFFQSWINSLIAHYQRQIYIVDEWLSWPALAAVLLLGAWAWWTGRDARRKARDRKSAAS